MMKVIGKYFGLTIMVALMFSCVDVSKISVSELSVKSAGLSGLNSANVNLSAIVKNGTRPISIEDAEILLYIEGDMVAVLSLNKPVELERGVKKSNLGVKVVFSQNILSLISDPDLTKKIFEAEIEGYVKIKTGIFSKKFRIHKSKLTRYVPEDIIRRYIVI